AIVTQRALENLSRLGAELWDVKGTARDAIATTDAIRFLKIYNSVGVLHDGCVRRTRCQTPRIGAVHALILAHQEHQVAVFVFMFVELDQIPVVPGRFRHGLVGIVESSFGEGISVPFETGYLARFAANARGRVYELANCKFAVQPGAGHTAGM